MLCGAPFVCCCPWHCPCRLIFSAEGACPPWPLACGIGPETKAKDVAVPVSSVAALSGAGSMHVAKVVPYKRDEHELGEFFVGIIVEAGFRVQEVLCL